MTTKNAKPIQKSKKLASVKPLAKVVSKRLTKRMSLYKPLNRTF